MRRRPGFPYVLLRSQSGALHAAITHSDRSLSPADRAGPNAATRGSLGSRDIANARVSILRSRHDGCKLWLVGFSADRSAIRMGWARHRLAVYGVARLAAADARGAVP